MNLFKNLGPQTTEALYSRVSSAYQGPVRTREELEQFLQRKLKEGRVRFENGHWVLLNHELVVHGKVGATFGARFFLNLPNDHR